MNKRFETEMLEKAIIQKGNLLKSCFDDEIFKSWSGDLQKRFPNAQWKTINGARVLVNGGKVVAGLDGFNGEIDKFFESKRKSDGGEGESKKETRQENKKEMSEGMKDKVDYFKELETKEEKEKYINTLKNKWIPETEEGLKKAKDEKVKKIYSDLLEGLKNELLPAVEKEMKNFNEFQPKPVTLDTFKDIAKKSKDVADFIKRTREVKNVPPEVAQEFFSKYGKDKSQEDAARAFMNEHGSKATK